MEEVLKICITVLATLGGSSGIIILVCKFLTNKIAETLQAKYQLELDKKLEEHKAVLDSKIYVTKAKYDLEIETFKELSLKFYDVVYYANCLINPGICKILTDPAEQDKIDNERYKKLSKCDVEAQTALMSQRAFIPEDIYQLFLEIHKDGIGQINAYERRFNKSLICSDSEKRKFSDEEYNRSREMSNKLDNVNAKIRERLDSLIII